MNLFKRTKPAVSIEAVSIEENTKIFLDDFKKLVKKGNSTTLNVFIKFFVNSIQGELISKCFYLDRNYPKNNVKILHSLLLDLHYSEYTKSDLTISVAKTPIISCIWNHRSMIDNLMDIGECNDNPFNGVEIKNNTHSTLINPLGIVIVDSGNHSTNSAIIHNEGKLIINEIVDISSLFKKYKFNGCDYVDVKTNKKVNMEFLKNNSQPFLYSLGLLFEMSRILAEK